MQSHTRLEALRYDGLCCPRRSSLVRPPPTSARRSATSRAALIGFAVTGSTRAASPEAGDSGAETDLSCSVLDCVIVPLPLRRRVSGAAFQGLHTVHGLHPGGLGSAPACSPLTRGFFTTRIQDSSRTDRSLARRPKGDFVMALRQSGLPFRRPPATGPLGRYPDRTPTGKPSTAFRTHTPSELLQCAAVHQGGAGLEPDTFHRRRVIGGPIDSPGW